ncbi:MAG: hypothetical protein ABGZ53_01515 [Fuerstiella sp.]|jgi:hypothetical protein|nr:hypothetical protein [Fuerstiella sp.]
MPTLEVLIAISGIIHLGTLFGSAQVPRELKFREELPKLNPLLRHWVLVAGGYIIFNITSFGVISLVFRSELAEQTVIARVFCGYVSIFWLIRLVIQLFFFDAKPYLRNTLLKLGYHGLTMVFLWQTVVYGWAAFGSPA